MFTEGPVELSVLQCFSSGFRLFRKAMGNVSTFMFVCDTFNCSLLENSSKSNTHTPNVVAVVCCRCARNPTRSGSCSCEAPLHDTCFFAVNTNVVQWWMA